MGPGADRLLGKRASARVRHSDFRASGMGSPAGAWVSREGVAVAELGEGLDLMVAEGLSAEAEEEPQPEFRWWVWAEEEDGGGLGRLPPPIGSAVPEAALLPHGLSPPASHTYLSPSIYYEVSAFEEMNTSGLRLRVSIA
ncbi:membrane protein insertase YidC [Striga asiatica]|uniref:Membrane protein insertase YidC n=1 Tax=Striga asiatica TaxID=4170 RepID=A0A5A7QH72_STRAF|nr:membrane protein insertase YidC [Striga asiatica]